MKDFIKLQIEKYLDGEFSPEEKLSFENLLNSDAAYRDEWNNHLMAKKLIELQIENSLRNKMQSWSKNNSSASFIGISWFKIASVAACLFIALGAAHFYASQNYSNDALLASSASILSDQTRGDRDQPKTNPVFDAIRLIESNPSQAKTLLQQLYQQESSTETQQLIEWNLLRAELALDNVERVNILLNDIISNPLHPYQKKATQLNQKLNSFWRNF